MAFSMTEFSELAISRSIFHFFLVRILQRSLDVLTFQNLAVLLSVAVVKL